jgi:hypothetical protein
MNNQPAVLSLEELANSFCLMMANAYRLIEDGEKLHAAGRHLGAIGSFQAATDELVRGHLISKAVTLTDRDGEGWKEFWSGMNDRSKRLEVLEREIHPEIYKSDDSRRRYHESFALLGLDFVCNRFEEASGRFLPPGGSLGGLSSMEEAAKSYYEYVIGLYHAFNFYGLPNPATQAQTFWGLRMGAQNESLAR